MLTDEDQDEIAAWLESQEPEDDSLVSEWEYYEQEREKDIGQAICPHRDTGREPVSSNPFAETMVVCYDCGCEWR